MYTKLMSDALSKWYHENKRDLPWRQTKDPYAIWVSEIMLQQTRVDTVIPYYLRFIQRLPTVRALAKCEDDQLYKLWEGLGYYRRIQNMKIAAQQIINEHDGAFPTTYDTLLTLKGIGAYTAGAIASIAYEEKVSAVDGNVCRVYARLFEYPKDIKQEKNLKEIKENMSAFYEVGIPSVLTQGFMELGATVCKVSNPSCVSCPLHEYCRAYHQDTISLYPYASKKKSVEVYEKTVYILRYKDMIALHQPKNEGMLQGLYELIHVNHRQSQKEIIGWLIDHEIEVASIILKKPMKHLFSHQTWKMKVIEVRCLNENHRFTWYSLEDIRINRPMSTAFKKVLDNIL